MTLGGLDDIDWSALRHAYGPAADVPGLLREAADGADPATALDDLDVKIFHQGGCLFTAATAALPFLVSLAESPRGTVRPAVLELVGRLAYEAADVAARIPAGDPPETGGLDPLWPPAWRSALPRLLALLDDPDVEVRRALPDTLSSATGEADLVVPALLARRTAEPDAAARLGLILAAGGLAPGCTAGVLPEALIWLRGLRDDPDPQVRLAAVVALSDAVGAQRLGDELDTLVRAVCDEGAAIWADVPWAGSVTALVGRAGALLGDDAAARTALCLAVIGHPDAGRRIAAGRSAAELLSLRCSPGERLLPALAERTADRSAAVRVHAAHLVAALGDGHADALAARLDDGEPLSAHGDERIADIAAWGLARRRDPRCLPYLAERIAARELSCADAFSGGGAPYSTALPSVRVVLAPLGGHAAALLPAIRERLRTDTGASVRRNLAKALAGWGAAAAPAVPELAELLDTPAQGEAAEALAAIGPAAARAAGALRTPRRADGDRDAHRARVVLPWAYWKITGDPGPAVAGLDAAIGQGPPAGLWRYAADLGPHAAAHAGRFRAMLGAREEWTRVEAARAVHRITGDAETASRTLCASIYPLARGEYLPVRWAALRYLAEMGPAATERPGWALRHLLASDRRHRCHAGWRAFAGDRELRELATRVAGRP